MWGSELNRGILLLLGCLAQSACSGNGYSNALPDSKLLGNPRGNRIVRVITHMHSPYSWDACDKNGLTNGVPNATCLEHLKAAICTNKDDFVFLTDHPDAMAQYEMRELLLVESKDTVVLKSGVPYANQVGSCANSFVPTLLVGFESKLMAMGMTQHLNTNIQTRSTLYTENDAALVGQLRGVPAALVFVPHPENRTVADITALGPDGIEIYNFHANIDPKIRYADLQVPPFQNIPGFLTYLVDPYRSLIPDFGFMHFLEVFAKHNTTWNSLIAAGASTSAAGTLVVGIGGTDSHENAFSQIVGDGERLDSHRRILKFMSNHVLVSASDPDLVKQAIKDGHSMVVFEGLGSPAQMDFYANVGTTVAEMGGSGTSLGTQTATLVVKAPTLHSQSPQGPANSIVGLQTPIIRLRLKRVTTSGADQIVATSEGTDIQYSTTTPGAYRAEISIVPRHLSSFLDPFAAKAYKEYPWIITNHVYLNP